MDFYTELEIGESYFTVNYKNEVKKAKLSAILIDKNGPSYVFSDEKDTWQVVNRTLISADEGVVRGMRDRRDLHLTGGVY